MKFPKWKPASKPPKYTCPVIVIGTATMVREGLWISRELEMKDGTIAPASFYLMEGDGYGVSCMEPITAAEWIRGYGDPRIKEKFGRS